MNQKANGTILVVEDESITALDIQQSLRRLGYAVPHIAGTGLEAIELARQNRPDLVLMDIRLKGGMDGITAAEQIHLELNTPVVFLTAYADCATLQRAKNAQPFAYLLKPFEETVLATTIEIALHKHQGQVMLLQQSAEALHLSQERFDRLSENVADYAVLLLDTAGRILSWNPGAERIHGWHASEMLGQRFSQLYPETDVAQGKPLQELESACAQGKHWEQRWHVRKDGTLCWTETAVVALRTRTGELSGYLKLTHELQPSGKN